MGSFNLIGIPGIQSLSQATNDFYLSVAKGEIAGHSSINKFGHNPAAATGEDVWGGGGAYAFFPATAQAMDIVSTSANDTAAGTGARTVIVYGLDASWNEVSETVTLNGATPVNLVNSYIRMFRAIVLTAGSSETNEGNITVEIQGSATVAIYIEAGDGQTQHAIYTIPAGKTAYFLKGYVALADDNKDGEIAEFQWQARPNNAPDGAWAIKGQVGLNSIGTSSWQYLYAIPSGPIPEKTDIRIRVVNATVPLGVVGGFDLVLIDN